MKRPMAMVVLGIGMLLAAGAAAQGAPDAQGMKPLPKMPPAAKGPPLKPVSRPGVRPGAMQYAFQSVSLEIYHRVFHDFSEKDTAKPREVNQVGDTEYSYRVVDYVPDFVMALKSQRVTSRSAEPNNPAFQIIVSFKNKAQDTTWAMLKSPPHFARKSLLAFKILRIDFSDRPSVVAPDETNLVVPPAPASGAVRPKP